GKVQMSCTEPGSESRSLTESAAHSRTAVVTGAAAGIGQALAKGFARAGYRVAVADLDADGATGTAQQINDEGGRAEAFAVDISSADSVGAFARSVTDRIGPVLTLVNCAGWDD